MSFLLWPNYHNQFGSGSTGYPGKKSITSESLGTERLEKRVGVTFYDDGNRYKSISFITSKHKSN